MFPYNRHNPSSSSSSTYPASRQQQQQQQQGQSHHSHQQQQQQDRASTHSPEQIRSSMLGRSYHDDHRSTHSHSHHHQRGSGLVDMHEGREAEDRNAGRRWIDDPHRSFAPPADRVSSYPRQQTQPPPQQQPGPFSHPSSPSQRPRTPPYQQQYSHHRPSQWDPSQSGPMSAPPSMVPRINPNAPPPSSSMGANSTASTHSHSGPLSHHTSPILPGLMRGSKNHSRLPSWGPHSSSNASNTPLTRTDGPAVGSSGAGGSSGHAGANSGSGSLPPPILPYRGQSVGLGDPFSRSDLGNQGEKRKRPASESPPNNGSTAAAASASAPSATTAPGRQSSPTLRGDPMSMSSILGPSSRGGEMDKRRRLEGGVPLSAPYNPSIKTEAGGNAPAPTSAAKFNAGNLGASPASNLARRKWSGPIAEQAAQQAAAWRAQEQRWGSSRSPKIGMTALGPEQRQTPPIGSIPPSRRDNSPSRGEGHKRQRSDGYPGGSPLNRSIPLRAQSPLPSSKQPRSTESSPTGYSQPLPGTSRPGGSPSKPLISSKPVASFYRPASSPPPSAPMMTYQQHHQHQHQQQQQHHHHHSGVSERQLHAYGQPSYHAYDSQGRPVEIDVDEVRGGAFAGHGNPTAPMMQEQGGYRPGASYNDARHRPAQTSRPSAPPAKAHAPVSAPVAAPSHHSKALLPGQIAPRPAANNSKDREVKQRSVTPNALGPARGLLAPWYEKMRLHEHPAAQRPATASKDFNMGPKVDSEAVWETLQEVARLKDIEGLTSKTRHLGNFRYDPRKTPLLSGDLLQANVGATLEVRVSGRHLGMGPLQGEKTRRARDGAWALGWRAREKMGLPEVQAVQEKAEEEDQHDGQAAAAADFWSQDALVNRKVWGSDVYTDDSDVVAMCLHSGWIEGPIVQDVPGWVPPGKATIAWRQMTRSYADQGLVEDFDGAGKAASVNLTRLHSTADLSVILRIAPKLIAYKGSQRGGVKSRSWGNGHDGVSLMIESVTLHQPGYASGERGLRNVKHRIDHLARLKTLAAIAMDTEVEDKLTKQIQGGGLVDIQLAATVSRPGDAVAEKPFWMVDVRSGKVEA